MNRTIEEEKHLASLSKKINSLEDEIIHLMDKHPALYAGVLRRPIVENAQGIIYTLNAVKDSIRSY